MNFKDTITAISFISFAENKEVVNDKTGSEDTMGTKLNVSIIPDCDPEQEDQVSAGD